MFDYDYSYQIEDDPLLEFRVTLLGAVVLDEKVLVAGDAKNVSTDHASDASDWSVQDKLYSKHDGYTSVVWGWYGQADVGEKFRIYMENTLFDSWDSFEELARPTLRALNIANGNPSTGILVAGYMAGVAGITWINKWNAIEHNANVSFSGFGRVAAKTGYLAAQIARPSMSEEQRFLTAMRSAVATVEGLDFPIHTWTCESGLPPRKGDDIQAL